MNDKQKVQDKQQLRLEAIEKGRKIEQISSDIYLLNNKIKKLEKQIIQTLQQFQNVKNKHNNQKQISMRLQFLSRTLNSTLRYLNQYKISNSMINVSNVQ